MTPTNTANQRLPRCTSRANRGKRGANDCDVIRPCDVIVVLVAARLQLGKFAILKATILSLEQLLLLLLLDLIELVSYLIYWYNCIFPLLVLGTVPQKSGHGSGNCHRLDLYVDLA